MFGGANADLIKGGSGNDVLYGEQDNDIVFGGNGNDLIFGEDVDRRTETDDVDRRSVSDDILIGDRGSVVFGTASGDQTIRAYYDAADMFPMFRPGLTDVLKQVDANADGTPGDDTLDGGAGKNLVMGGLGTDTITLDTVDNVVVGDNGTAIYVNSGALLYKVTSREADQGSTDHITIESGGNSVIGGLGEDQITISAGGNYVIGDNGEVEFDTTSGALKIIKSTSPTYGAKDTIQIDEANNFVIGGSGDDDITLNAGDNFVLGDNGEVAYDAAGRLTHVKSTDPTEGGVDTIVVDGGRNFVLGGSGADVIDLRAGDNVVLGDNGLVDYDDTTGKLVLVQTTDHDYGGVDDIDILDGVDGNYVFGGTAGDDIDVGAGDSFVFGDHGEVRYTNSGVLALLQSLDTGKGGDDDIRVGDGDSFVVGGFGLDKIAVATGRQVVLGDSGLIDFDDATGKIIKVMTTAPGVGRRDEITVSNLAGEVSYILGGADGDDIDVGVGDNVVLGDNGILTFSSGVITRVETDSPGFGGNDEIDASGGNNIVLGGFGTDTITTLGGNDRIVGDNGSVDWTNGLAITNTDTDSSTGARDIIRSGGGNDVVLGGVGGDEIHGGAGTDLLVGDHGILTYDVSGQLTLVETKDPVLGGVDEIYGDEGDDILLGVPTATCFTAAQIRM